MPNDTQETPEEQTQSSSQTTPHTVPETTKQYQTLLIARIDEWEDIVFSFEVMKSSTQLTERLEELAKHYDEVNDECTVCVIEGTVKEFNFTRGLSIGKAKFNLATKEPTRFLTAKDLLKFFT